MNAKQMLLFGFGGCNQSLMVGVLWAEEGGCCQLRKGAVNKNSEQKTRREHPGSQIRKFR